MAEPCEVPSRKTPCPNADTLDRENYALLFRHNWVDLQDKGAIEVMPFEACSDDSVLIIDPRLNECPLQFVQKNCLIDF